MCCVLTYMSEYKLSTFTMAHLKKSCIAYPTDEKFCFCANNFAIFLKNKMHTFFKKNKFPL